MYMYICLDIYIYIYMYFMYMYIYICRYIYHIYRYRYRYRYRSVCLYPSILLASSLAIDLSFLASIYRRSISRFVSPPACMPVFPCVSVSVFSLTAPSTNGSRQGSPNLLRRAPSSRYHRTRLGSAEHITAQQCSEGPEQRTVRHTKRVDLGPILR